MRIEKPSSPSRKLAFGEFGTELETVVDDGSAGAMTGVGIVSNTRSYTLPGNDTVVMSEPGVKALKVWVHLQ